MCLSVGPTPLIEPLTHDLVFKISKNYCIISIDLSKYYIAVIFQNFFFAWHDFLQSGCQLLLSFSYLRVLSYYCILQKEMPSQKFWEFSFTFWYETRSFTMVFCSAFFLWHLWGKIFDLWFEFFPSYQSRQKGTKGKFFEAEAAFLRPKSQAEA